MQDVSRGGRRGLHHAGGVILYRDLRSDHVSVGGSIYSGPIDTSGQGLNIFGIPFQEPEWELLPHFLGGVASKKQNCQKKIPVSKVFFQRKV